MMPRLCCLRRMPHLSHCVLLALLPAVQPDPLLRPSTRELYATLLACPPLAGGNGMLGPSCSSSEREGPDTGGCKEGGPARAATADENGSIGKTSQSSTNLCLEQVGGWVREAAGNVWCACVSCACACVCTPGSGVWSNRQSVQVGAGVHYRT